MSRATKTEAQPMPARKFRDLSGNAADLLYGLFDRARDNLSADDLASLSAAGDAAQSTVRNLADLCEGLGCLILGDGNYSDAGGSGRDLD